MGTLGGLGPDLALVGAARSGTSFLGAALAHHPRIDAGAVKEPDYYSIRWGTDPAWYDGLFRPREEGLFRLDASVSYTYPQHPAALERLHEHAPDVRVVYAVRDPMARLVSHYQLLRYYSGQDELGTLAEALALKELFVGSGDYATWLPRLRARFGEDRVLVVPFPLITGAVGEVASAISVDLGLGEWTPPADDNPFRNDVRQFRHPVFRVGQRLARRTGIYPAIRRTVGADRLRRWRSAATKPVKLPSRGEELATLSPEQRAQVEETAASAREAVATWLTEQDRRRGLTWAASWTAHTEGP